MDKKVEKKGQKKFRHLKDQNPIFFLETFEYNTKTHYIVSSQSTLYLGYMERYIFNQITNYKINSEVTSFSLFQDTLYFGLKNGSILYVSLQHAYNQIPYSKIQSIDGKSILAISLETEVDSKEPRIYTVSDNSSIKLYHQVENGFKLSVNLTIQKKISMVVSKNPSKQNLLPCFMIYIKEYPGYPILLTNIEIKALLQKQTNIYGLLSEREKIYLEDQKITAVLTSIDFNPSKNIAALGYADGTIEILRIQKTVQTEFFIMLPELKVIQKDGIVNLSLNEDPLCPYLGFITEGSLTGLNYEKRSNPFARIKVQKGEKGKEISVCKWTKDKYFLVGAVSTEEKKRFPKIFCIEQDVSNDQ